ncbi:MAG TPA: molybdopterin-guanine dinucleotide biosynthesis protein B [Thermoanaerobaculaceae bacterium]|nr:molybdopterin-guanine dinucleotide biosynthesis protein B [Thermoanaerobaculaceae bacterium]HRS16679.1 molybdopterin-guanine dinucleotide biosynthesis protein B [Thermoanaerobaculaceae bacterium]
MRILHVVGRQNNGKTTLVCDLVAELSARGFRVGTIKHSTHDHELDREGKDSHRHRIAGARPAAVITAGQLAVYLPRRAEEDPIAALAPLFEACDLVLVEGFIEREGPKIEVWRREIGKPLLARERPGIVAVVSDDAPEAPVPVWPRSDVAGLASRVIATLGLTPCSGDRRR